MKRYTLQELYTAQQFATALGGELDNLAPMYFNVADAVLETFISNVLYGYFYEDEVAYGSCKDDEVERLNEIKGIFIKRLGYDIAVRYSYWSRKYQQIKELLTAEDMNLLQTSKMISSSEEMVDTAGGSFQKSASTPTGVSATTGDDSIDIDITSTDTSLDSDVTTGGYVDKYTNYQGKTATSNKQMGSRSGNVLREGSISELVDVLEKLPATFADEISRALCKHFIFLYEY